MATQASQEPLLEAHVRMGSKEACDGAGSPRAGSKGLKKTISLQDLTDRLVSLGIYGQYLNWRDGYRQWRQGQATGAKGEATLKTLGEKAEFTYWYPDQVSYRFRQTVSYWMGVLFLEGSLLFVMASLFGAFGVQKWPAFQHVLTDRPYFAGAMCFTMGTYLALFEVINLGIKDGERLNYLPLNLNELREKYEVELFTIVGVLAYFLGAVFWQISFTAVCVLDPQISKDYANFGVVGGSLFSLGGLCECLYNKVWRSLPNTAVWWISVFDFTGGVCIFASTLQLTSEYKANMLCLIGSVEFVCGAALTLWMWKSEQFGITLLSQLNAFAREAGVPLSQRSVDGAVAVPNSLAKTLGQHSFSVGGVFFLIVYGFCGAMSVMNVCFGGGRSDEVRDLSITLQGVINMVIVHMVLILHSAGLQKVPQEQPFRFLMIMMRFVAVMMSINSMLNFWIFLNESDNGWS